MESSYSYTSGSFYDFSNYSNLPSGLLYTHTDHVIISIVNPCILALGLIGNIAFLFVMASVPRMWTVTNMYLINMAVADILFLTVAVSVKLANYIGSPVIIDQSTVGHVGSVTTSLLLDLSFFASLFLVTLVSLEKFYAVCHPLRHRLIGGMKRTTKLIIGVWLLALMVALVLLPTRVGNQKFFVEWPQDQEFQNFPDTIEVEQPIVTWYVEFHNIVQTVPFFVALTLNVVFYVKIIMRLSQKVSTVSTESSAQELRRLKIRNQVALMLIVNGVAFFVCLAPFQLLSFILTISQRSGASLSAEHFNNAQWVGRILTYINPVLNPFIYNLTNPRYRAAFHEAFTCKGKRHHSEESKTTNDNTVGSML
ncbi:neuromedin-U receptor 2-like [Asterias amurensis]|uniref:neuromedin-U receptor 2-like n=1 Tax=Asterias amurensis TaxID=7602 RepID=UPI003AB74790